MHPVIAIPAYSRASSLKRLLNSINEAVYPDGPPIELIITVDGGASQSVVDIADSFIFKHGSKTVEKKERNIGLNEQILWCGDLARKYGSVIILEDDLYVDKYFYQYAVEALCTYKNDPRIMGIALFSPRYNQMAKLGFEAMSNGFSAYFAQHVCTWGEAFTETQWSRFRTWLEVSDSDEVDKDPHVPAVVKTWRGSWDKYLAAYMIQNDLYFVYPYQSYTTNFSDPGGVHSPSGTYQFQVPLAAANRPAEQYSFCDYCDSLAVYDAYLEPKSPELYKELGIRPKDIEIDIYGIKPLSVLQKKRYVLTSKKCSNVMKTFKLGMRPVEKIVSDPIQKKVDPRFGFSNQVYLAESKNIESIKRPFYEQINYFSYYQMENKYFIRRYILNYLSKLLG